MSIEFKYNQSEEYYKKLLLLDKVKPSLDLSYKEYIFEKNYCWDILLKDKKYASHFAYMYIAEFNKAVPDLEPYLAKESVYAYYYAKNILKGRFLLGEELIFSDHKHNYIIEYLDDCNNSKPIEEWEYKLHDCNAYVQIAYSIFIKKRPFIKNKSILSESKDLNRIYNNFLWIYYIRQTFKVASIIFVCCLLA